MADVHHAPAAWKITEEEMRDHHHQCDLALSKGNAGPGAERESAEHHAQAASAILDAQGEDDSIHPALPQGSRLISEREP